MLITVDRFVSDDGATLSRILLDGRFVCFGLEDPHRDRKIPGRTRIAAGRYRVALRTQGGFHGRYSKRFGDMHRGMLHVLDVPEFTWILIHCGNTAEHTQGCLLVGLGCQAHEGNKKLLNSADAYRLIYPQAVDAAAAGDLEIAFLDHDGAG